MNDTPTTCPAREVRQTLNRAYLAGHLSARAYNAVWTVYFDGMGLQRFRQVLRTGEAINAPGVGVRVLKELRRLFLDRAGL